MTTTHATIENDLSYTIRMNSGLPQLRALRRVLLAARKRAQNQVDDPCGPACLAQAQTDLRVLGVAIEDCGRSIRALTEPAPAPTISANT